MLQSEIRPDLVSLSDPFWSFNYSWRRRPQGSLVSGVNRDEGALGAWADFVAQAIPT